MRKTHKTLKSFQKGAFGVVLLQSSNLGFIVETCGPQHPCRQRCWVNFEVFAQETYDEYKGILKAYGDSLTTW